MLAFWLLIQSFVACQSVQQNDTPLEANLSLQTFTDSWLDPEKAILPATNIVFQSIDGGQTWQDVSAGLPGGLPVEYFLTQNGEVILGAESGLYRSKSTASAPIWENERQLMGQFSGVFPGRTGLYAYSNQDGFFQSISKGTWMPVFMDMKIQARPFRTIMETLNGTLFVGTDNGIFKSVDQGKTWKHVYEDGWMIHMVESNGVLLCTNQHGILRSTDNGEHWDLVISEGGVGIAVEVIEGGFAAITYNTESKTRRVRISSDGGKTWQPIDAGLRPHANIASIKQVGKYFFCGHPDGIFRSSDRGKTWQLLLCSINKKVFNLSVSGQVIYAIPLNGGC
jgi:photosystem II stability/assembly factor-like uncharacterized protein